MIDKLTSILKSRIVKKNVKCTCKFWCICSLIMYVRALAIMLNDSVAA